MSSTAGITAPPVRKQRQTRIVEHLKAVKKSASSGAGVSTPRAKLDAVMEAQQQASKVSNVKTVTAAVTSPKKGQNVQGVSAVPAEKEGAEDIAITTPTRRQSKSRKLTAMKGSSPLSQLALADGMPSPVKTTQFYTPLQSLSSQDGNGTSVRADTPAQPSVTLRKPMTLDLAAPLPPLFNTGITYANSNAASMPRTAPIPLAVSVSPLVSAATSSTASIVHSPVSPLQMSGSAIGRKTSSSTASTKTRDKRSLTMSSITSDPPALMTGSAPHKALSALSMQSYNSSQSRQSSSSSLSREGMAMANSAPLVLSMSSNGRACLAPAFLPPISNAVATQAYGTVPMSRSESHTAMPMLAPPAPIEQQPQLIQQTAWMPTQVQVHNGMLMDTDDDSGGSHPPSALSLSASSLSSARSSLPLITPPASSAVYHSSTLPCSPAYAMPSPDKYQSLQYQHQHQQEQQQQQRGGKKPIAEAPSVALYPEKERLQSGWKFPLVGLNLSTNASGAPTTSLNGATPAVISTSTSPLTGVHSTFPSIDALNNPVQLGAPIVDLLPVSGNGVPSVSAQATEMERRKSRIQAWLNSPEMSAPGGNDSPWSTLPQRFDDDDSMNAGPSSPTSSSGAPAFALAPYINHLPLNLTIRPSNAMVVDPTMSSSLSLQSALDVKSAGLSIPYEDYLEEPSDSVRVMGKSVRALKMTSRKRARQEMQESASHAMGTSSERKTLNSLLASAYVTPHAMKKGASAPGHAGAATTKKGRKKGKNRVATASECFCESDTVKGGMVQCNTCNAWYHLDCLDIKEEDLGEDWFCFRCTGTALPKKLQALVDAASGMTAPDYADSAAASYPSPNSPVRPAVTLDTAVQVEFQTPTTPRQSVPMREPTFSHATTPRMDYKSHFQDTNLALAPSPRPGAIPVTPQHTVQSQNDYVRRHAYSHSLSRSYAPATPAMGAVNQSSSAAAARPQYMSSAQAALMNMAGGGMYSPQTPMIGGPAKRSRHTRNASSMQFVWDELPARRHDDDDGSRHWDHMYTHTAGTKTTVGSQTAFSGMPTPFTPLMRSTRNSFSLEAGFLPPVDPEEMSRQRFLELTSTPSRWNNSPRFSTAPWP